MSFGFSIGDLVLLVQLAHKTFRNCQQAGEEYREIASEVRCLHGVLRILREDGQKPGSMIFRQDPSITAQLIETANGCKDVLNTLDAMLVKYDAMQLDSAAGFGKKLKQKVGFGMKLADLNSVREKLITYTSTTSVLIDIMQLQGTQGIEAKVEGGFVEMRTQYELLRKQIYNVASQKSTEERMGAIISSLSLSTYAGDEKHVWKEVRAELIAKGFRSETLKKYKDVLQAY